MLRTLIALLILMATTTLVNTQDGMCKPRPRSPQVITADNVQLICGTGANPGPIIEARWHESESILVLLSLTGEGEANPLAPSVHVWDVEKNIGINRRHLIDRSITQLELTSDSIIAGTNSGTVISWDLMQQEFLYELPITDGEVTELLLHPTGEWLLVVIDHTVAFNVNLEQQTVSEIHSQDSEELTLDAVAFSNDGRLLAAAGNSAIGIWDTNSWDARSQGLLPVGQLGELYFIDEGAQLIVMVNSSVSRWAFPGKTLNILRELLPDPDTRRCLILGGDVSKDGSLLMTIDVCEQLRAWDLRVDQEIYFPKVEYVREDHFGVATRFSPDGRYLTSSAGPDSFSWRIVPEYD